MSETGDVGDESKADNRGNIWRSPVLWIMCLAIPALVGGGVWGVRQYFAPILGKSEPELTGLVNPPPPSVDVPVRVPVAQRALGAVAGVAVGNAPPPSQVWRVAGWLGCTVPLDDGSGGMRPCGESTRGGQTISRTSSVVLQSDGNQRRVVSMSTCRWIERDRYVLCDVDGERVTPWTGRGAVTQVVDPVASKSREQSAPVSERSDLAGADARGVSPASRSPAGAPVKAGTVVTVVADSEYASRPWR
ncbi:hypothetical protein D9M69_474960 [compost metagenome]